MVICSMCGMSVEPKTQNLRPIIMRHFYSFLLYLLLPVVLLRLCWRGCKAPAYWQRINQRFGFTRALPQHKRVWIHAVSVGESLAAVPLIRALQRQYPQQHILITCMTPTASQQIRSLFGDSVAHVYLPYDYPDAVRRFLQATQPSLGIIMETEWWPNLFHACKTRHIPLILANTRLSVRSTQAYQRYAAGLTRQTLAAVSVIAAQTETHAQRLRELGVSAAKIQVTGSIKFDIQLPAGIAEQAEALRATWQARRVWIAASTHEGEEEQVLAAFNRLKQVFADSLLIIVPRHPERFARVARLCEQAGLRVVKRSSGTFCQPDTDVFLGDTMGELPLFYAASDVAFVGGSLVATGGHNMLEPAALGRPVIMGKHVFNFEEIAHCLLATNAAVAVDDAKALGEVLISWFADANLRHQIGENGQQFVAHNRGALAKLLAIIQRFEGALE